MRGLPPFTLELAPFTLALPPFMLTLPPFMLALPPCVFALAPFRLALAPFMLRSHSWYNLYCKCGENALNRALPYWISQTTTEAAGHVRLHCTRPVSYTHLRAHETEADL
eukprot:741830-Rhodomonas_salina.1